MFGCFFFSRCLLNDKIFDWDLRNQLINYKESYKPTQPKGRGVSYEFRVGLNISVNELHGIS